MILGILAIICIPALSFAIRKAVKNTPFARNCPCTPHIEHLRWVENGEKREDKKRENLW